MLRPTDIENLKGEKSRYAVVIGVAKRARDIADRAEQDGVILLEKPVSMAIADLTTGDYKILMSENEEDTPDEMAEIAE
ncbi:MAG: DNA-directed RNA polymerase subunit omega [Ruminococcaceae bacterium]|nr:DNA-directed RNA polymerase subunit omega [Oscillospiraceae bacterium]